MAEVAARRLHPPGTTRVQRERDRSRGSRTTGPADPSLVDSIDLPDFDLAASSAGARRAGGSPMHLQAACARRTGSASPRNPKDPGGTISEVPYRCLDGVTFHDSISRTA